MNYEITLEENPSDDELNILRNGLAEYAFGLFGETSVADVTFFLRDESGVIVGGVHGNYGSFGWMYVDTLWVSERLRGKDYGTRLINLIEDAALKKGCTQAYLNTFSFQAPEFYKKLGYTVFAELEDFPAGHSRVFMRKRLSKV
ncbi:MAG: GNAT family N-acetyltransferase [Pyrinomonadaceae bacterium]